MSKLIYHLENYHELEEKLVELGVSNQVESIAQFAIDHTNDNLRFELFFTFYYRLQIGDDKAYDIAFSIQENEDLDGKYLYYKACIEL